MPLLDQTHESSVEQVNFYHWTSCPFGHGEKNMFYIGLAQQCRLNAIKLGLMQTLKEYSMCRKKTILSLNEINLSKS